MTETYYAVLEVSRTASAAEIKAAYRKLIQQVHPDLIANASEYWRKQAEEKTKDINEAYDVLSNSEKRRLYDQRLDADAYRQAQACQTRAASQSHNSTTVNTQSHNQASTGYATPSPGQTVSPQAQGPHAQAPSRSTATDLTVGVIIVIAVCGLAKRYAVVLVLLCTGLFGGALCFCAYLLMHFIAAIFREFIWRKLNGNRQVAQS